MARIRRADYYATPFSGAFPILAYRLSPGGGLRVSPALPVDYFDSQGKMLPGGPYQYGSGEFSKYGTALVMRNGLWGMIDQHGTVLIPLQYERLEFSKHSSRWLQARINKRWGLIDSSGLTRVIPQYDEIIDFSDHMMAVKLQDKWGFIDESGTLIIPTMYNYVHRPFHEGFAAVRLSKENSVGFINKHNECITGFRFDYPYCVNKTNAHIRDLTKYYEFKNGFALVRNNNCEIGVINTDDQEVLPIRFYHVEVNDSTIIGHRKKRKLVYVIPR
ncbi:WG repeat-containing protein [Hymenobacter sp. BT594]|uniref:WG repeat-containing protein n=1 Tax=Hymenobacter guriensis TaxID=2793065 RepID=A0ABS0L732_9BACT|nr:WG repeat-containing protein [Hymenobacter guriensis]